MLSNKLFNPLPSYNWQSLIPEEVHKQTEIKLKNKEWKWYFTNFHEIQEEVHEYSCKAKETKSKYSCNCKPRIRPAIIAIFKAGTFGISGVARGREFFVNVPVEPVSDKSILTDSTLRPTWVLERLYQGFETLITLLKVYEVTGFIIDFGPPLKLYTEDSYKHRSYIKEITGDELWEIVHKEEGEEKCTLISSQTELLLQEGR